MQSTKNPNQPSCIITSIQNFILQSSLTHHSTNTTRHKTVYRAEVKESQTEKGRWDTSGPKLRKIILQRKIKARRVKILEFKEYNSKIVSADKPQREKDLKLDQFYLGFRPTVDMALVPLCNTWFIKGHKPSNHIRARIKSHVYTTE